LSHLAANKAALIPLAAYPERFYRIVAGLSLGGHLAELSPRAVQVLIAVLVRVNFKKGGIAWCGIEDLSRRTGYSHDTVERAIRDLERAELVIAVRSQGRKVTRYLLGSRLRELAELDPWAEHRSRPDERTQRRGGEEKRHAAVRAELSEGSTNQIENNQHRADAREGGEAANPVDVVVSDSSFDGERIHEDQERGDHPQGGSATTCPPSEAPSRASWRDAEGGTSDKIETITPPEQRLSAELMAELAELGVHRPGRLSRYGEGRVREALTMLADAKKRGNVASPPAWLMGCLKNGWPPKPKVEAQPFGVQTAQLREAAQRQEQERNDPAWRKRSDLARIATRCLPTAPAWMRKRPEELTPQLEAAGLTLAELLVYLDEREVQTAAEVREMAPNEVNDAHGAGDACEGDRTAEGGSRGEGRHLIV
jgi:DNA-binding transcriptional ArsR family regulator